MIVLNHLGGKFGAYPRPSDGPFHELSARHPSIPHVRGMGVEVWDVAYQRGGFVPATRAQLLRDPFVRRGTWTRPPSDILRILMGGTFEIDLSYSTKFHSGGFSESVLRSQTVERFRGDDYSEDLQGEDRWLPPKDDPPKPFTFYREGDTTPEIETEHGSYQWISTGAEGVASPAGRDTVVAGGHDAGLFYNYRAQPTTEETEVITTALPTVTYDFEAEEPTLGPDFTYTVEKTYGSIYSGGTVSTGGRPVYVREHRVWILPLSATAGSEKSYFRENPLERTTYPWVEPSPAPGFEEIFASLEPTRAAMLEIERELAALFAEDYPTESFAPTWLGLAGWRKEPSSPLAAKRSGSITPTVRVTEIYPTFQP